MARSNFGRARMRKIFLFSTSCSSSTSACTWRMITVHDGQTARAQQRESSMMRTTRTSPVAVSAFVPGLRRIDHPGSNNLVAKLFQIRCHDRCIDVRRIRFRSIGRLALLFSSRRIEISRFHALRRAAMLSVAWTSSPTMRITMLSLPDEHVDRVFLGIGRGNPRRRRKIQLVVFAPKSDG